MSFSLIPEPLPPLPPHHPASEDASLYTAKNNRGFADSVTKHICRVRGRSHFDRLQLRLWDLKFLFTCPILKEKNWKFSDFLLVVVCFPFTDGGSRSRTEISHRLPAPGTVRKERKCSGETEILHLLVHDTTRISS